MINLSIRKASRWAVPAVALLTLSACATPFRADVSRFQQLPPAQGQSFTVVAADPALAGGIEFGQYAQLVEAEMVRQGYRQASSPGTADLIVSFGYDVDNGRERVVSDGYYGSGFGGFGYDPFYRGGFYGRRGGYYGRRGFYGRGAFVYGFNDPFAFGGYGGGFGGVRSYTLYTGELDLKIDRAVDNQRLFEGKAQSLSRTNDLPYLVPNLVEAMFTGFPGNSGEVVQISVAPEERR